MEDPTSTLEAKRPIKPRHIDTRQDQKWGMPLGNGQVASAAPFRYQHMKVARRPRIEQHEMTARHGLAHGCAVFGNQFLMSS
jgi:hypothetical protein